MYISLSICIIVSVFNVFFEKGHLMTDKKFIEIVHSKKFILILFVILFLCITTIYGLLVLHEKRNAVADINDFEIFDSSSPEYMYCFDPSDGSENDIRGWMIHKGESVSYAAIKVALREQGSDNIYIIPTEITIRNDVTEAMNDGCTYDISGFSASSSNINPALDISAKNYTIYIYSDYNGRKFLIDTGLPLDSIISI